MSYLHHHHQLTNLTKMFPLFGISFLLFFLEEPLVTTDILQPASIRTAGWVAGTLADSQGRIHVGRVALL